MPTELGGFDVRYVGQEANQIILQPVFMDEDIRLGFNIMPNVAHKKKMQFASKLERIVRKYTGCGFKPVRGMNFFDREVEVRTVKADVELCWDEFADTIYQELLNQGTAMPDIRATTIEQIVILRYLQGIKLDIQRIAAFGDPSNPDPAFDQVEGFWTVHYPELAAADLIPRVDTGSGTALAAGDATELLQAAYNNQPLELRGLPDNMKVFNVTGSVYNAYMQDIETGGGGDYGLMRMIEGNAVLYFRGIQVKPNWRWDGIMATDFNAPHTHLIELTTPGNKVLATDIVNPGEDFRVWYDEDDELLKIKARWKMGVNYIHPSLISVGY
ncbi:MAG: hypothetical protein HC874_14225 [Richelia sp. SL_2_1]|nr:hypothetical protein [Richelia sp. SL_2_1]